jgi:hypothetical protein
MKPPWYNPFKKAVRSGCYLVAHGAIALLIIGIFAVINWILVRIGDPRLFDICPLRYIFDLVDLAISGVFVVFGTIEAIRVFRESDDDAGSHA